MEFDMEKKKMLEVYHRSKEQQYAFDKIFREESQEEVKNKFPYFLIYFFSLEKNRFMPKLADT